MIISIDGNIPSKRAHSVNITKMAQGFLRNGEPVTLVTLFSWPLFREALKIKDIHEFYGIDTGVQIKRIAVWNRDFLCKTIGAKGFNERAASWIKNQQPEFFYGRGYRTPYLTVKEGIPTIAEIHSVNYSHPDLKKLFEVVHEEAFLGVVTIHEKIRDQYIKMGVPADKILVLEDGVDMAPFAISDDRHYWRKQLGLPGELPLIVYSGGLYAEKGIEEILNAAKGMQDFSRVQFLLVGGTPAQVGEWQIWCLNHKVKNVLFQGFVPPSKVPEFLKAADILIMPYSLKRQSGVMDVNTTSPLKLFEYMVAKRPIVTTRIPVIAKVVKHQESALLAEPDQGDDLVRCLQSLLKNDDMCRQLAEQAFGEAQKYTWKMRCQKIRHHFLGKSGTS